MDHSDKIQMIMDFADGTLDPGKEDRLFLLLSSDEELRQMFKSHINIKNSIHSGAGNIAQPAASKAAVFSALGLSMPPAGGDTAVASDKRSYYAATGISIMLVGLLLFFVRSDNPNKTVRQVGSPNITKNTAQIIFNKSVADNIPAVSSIEITKQKGNTHNTYGDKYVLSESNTPDSQNTAITETAEKKQYNTVLLELSSPVIETNNAEFKQTTNTPHNTMSGTSIYNPLSSGISITGLDRFSVEFRGSSYKSTQPPTISPKQYSPLNNMSLALAYNVNDNFSTGIDIRQETFFLRYEGTNNEQQFIYEQQPNFTTFSGSLKYKLDGWNGFRPFVAISAGGNSIGIVGRAMLGAEYNIFGNFSLMIGADFSNLTYSYQNNYFNSSKFGLNYGLIYSF
jgi:hypothetical protein